MPKNTNEKALAARERKAAAKDSAKKNEEREKEDAYWRSAGEGAKSKAQAKKEEEAAKKAEAAAKKAEAKRLAEEEEAALTRAKAKPGKVAGPKVTHHQLDLTREAEAAEAAEAAKQRQLAARRELDEAAYSRMVETENINRQEEAVEARSVEAAIDALSALSPGGQEGAAEKHPEKRMRAAWQAYEAANTPILRMEKPGLKQSQYRDMLWKMWQKAPENPLVQAALKK